MQETISEMLVLGLLIKLNFPSKDVFKMFHCHTGLLRKIQKFNFKLTSLTKSLFAMNGQGHKR